MKKKIENIIFICKLVCFILKWGFVYVVLNYHLWIFDFTFLMFRGFSYWVNHYTETIMRYEIFLLCLALFFIFRTFWKFLIYPLLKKRTITNFLYFIYYFGAFVGVYLIKFQYEIEHFLA